MPGQHAFCVPSECTMGEKTRHKNVQSRCIEYIPVSLLVSLLIISFGNFIKVITCECAFGHINNCCFSLSCSCFSLSLLSLFAGSSYQLTGGRKSVLAASNKITTFHLMRCVYHLTLLCLLYIQFCSVHSININAYLKTGERYVFLLFFSSFRN